MVILYEDNHVLVAEKPVNMPTQPDRSGDLDLITCLKDLIKVRDQKPGRVFLSPIHRLDRPVGGALVLGKTSKALSRLGKCLQQGQLDRIYLATVEGKVQEYDQLVDYLYKDRRKNQVYAVAEDHPQAKESRLAFQRIEMVGNRSLVRVRLETGRSHQIRVQFRQLGAPLYGDQKYGYRQDGRQQLALWSHQVCFPHPTRRELVEVTSWPPDKRPWQQFSQLRAGRTSGK